MLSTKNILYWYFKYLFKYILKFQNQLSLRYFEGTIENNTKNSPENPNSSWTLCIYKLSDTIRLPSIISIAIKLLSHLVRELDIDRKP